MKFKEVAAEVAAIVEEKNAAYGDSFNKAGEILKILYPNGVKPEQYGDFLAQVRIIDKQFRIATQKDAFGEDPWRDILGYALNAVARNADVKPVVVEKPRSFLLLDALDDNWNSRYVRREVRDGDYRWCPPDRATLFTDATEIQRAFEVLNVSLSQEFV